MQRPTLNGMPFRMAGTFSCCPTRRLLPMRVPMRLITRVARLV